MHVVVSVGERETDLINVTICLDEIYCETLQWSFRVTPPLWLRGGGGGGVGIMAIAGGVTG